MGLFSCMIPSSYRGATAGPVLFVKRMRGSFTSTTSPRSGTAGSQDEGVLPMGRSTTASARTTRTTATSPASPSGTTTTRTGGGGEVDELDFDESTTRTRHSPIFDIERERAASLHGSKSAVHVAEVEDDEDDENEALNPDNDSDGGDDRMYGTFRRATLNYSFQGAKRASGSVTVTQTTQHSTTSPRTSTFLQHSTATTTRDSAEEFGGGAVVESEALGRRLKRKWGSFSSSLASVASLSTVNNNNSTDRHRRSSLISSFSRRSSFLFGGAFGSTSSLDGQQPVFPTTTTSDLHRSSSFSSLIRPPPSSHKGAADPQHQTRMAKRSTSFTTFSLLTQERITTRLRRKESAPSFETSIAAALRDADTRERFAKHAENTHQQESAKFLNEAFSFREYFYERSKEWRQAKAMMILTTFIAEDSPYQVNISYNARVNTEQAYARYGSKWRLFDEAVHEVIQMVRFGAWASFVEEQQRQAQQLAWGD